MGVESAATAHCRNAVPPPGAGLGTAEVAQCEVGENKIRIEIKRTHQRPHCGFGLPQLLIYYCQQIMGRRLELVGHYCFFAPLDGLGELTQIGIRMRYAAERIKRFMVRRMTSSIACTFFWL